jgi:hypothetical protein
LSFQVKSDGIGAQCLDEKLNGKYGKNLILHHRALTIQRIALEKIL